MASSQGVAERGWGVKPLQGQGEEGECAARGDEARPAGRAAHQERQRPQRHQDEETDAGDADEHFQVTGFQAEVSLEVFEEFLDAHAQAVVAVGLPARAQRGRQEPGFGLAVVPGED